MEQKTIIPETTGEKIVKSMKKRAKEKKFLLAVSLLLIFGILGYSLGYMQGYHEALIDFNIIVGQVFRL